MPRSALAQPAQWRVGRRSSVFRCAEAMFRCSPADSTRTWEQCVLKYRFIKKQYTFGRFVSTVDGQTDAPFQNQPAAV